MRCRYFISFWWHSRLSKLLEGCYELFIDFEIHSLHQKVVNSIFSHEFASRIRVQCILLLLNSRLLPSFSFSFHKKTKQRSVYIIIYLLPQVGIKTHPDNSDNTTGANHSKKSQDINNRQLQFLALNILYLYIEPNGTDPQQNQNHKCSSMLLYIRIPHFRHTFLHEKAANNNNDRSSSKEKQWKQKPLPKYI